MPNLKPVILIRLPDILKRHDEIGATAVRYAQMTPEARKLLLHTMTAEAWLELELDVEYLLAALTQLNVNARGAFAVYPAAKAVVDRCDADNLERLKVAVEHATEPPPADEAKPADADA